MMKESGADTVEIYAGSCLGLCYWPTQVGYPHGNTGEHDLLGRTIEVCRKQGLRIVVYLNVWNRRAHDEHPEWRLLLHDGKGTCEHYRYRFGLCCFNSGYGDFFLNLLDELNLYTDCAGFWIDMIGWFGNFCYCEHCQKRFQEETGYDELPRTVNWNDRHWLAFQRCRERWLAKFAADVKNTVKKNYPERSVSLQTASLKQGYTGAITQSFIDNSDYLAADLYGNRYELSMICKLFSAFSIEKPIEFMVSRCENLSHHTTMRPFGELELRSLATLANQTCFSLIDAIDPEGTMDYEFYQGAGQLSQNLKRYTPLMSADSEIVAEVAVYYSFESAFDPCAAPAKIEAVQNELKPYRRNLNIVQALQEKHILFTFAGKKHLTQLNKFKVLILLECAVLDDEECRAIRAYVAGGGHLYVSGRTSLFDGQTGKKTDFALADLLGVHYGGGEFPRVAYLSISGKRPLMLESHFTKVIPDLNNGMVEVMSEVILPYSQPEENIYFGSAISNPPERTSGFPAMTQHSYGHGKVIYCAGILENEPYNQHRCFFADIIMSLLDQHMVTGNLPDSAEVLLFDQPSKKRLILSILNFTETTPSVLYNLHLRIHLKNKRIRQVFSGPEMTTQIFSVTGDDMEFSIARLDKLGIWVLEYV